MQTLLDALRSAADERPGAPAIRDGGTTVDYGGLHAAATGVAARLRDAGIAPGDRVSIVLPNSAEFAACYYGVLLAGGVVVGLNPAHAESTLQDRLRDCRPGALLISSGSPDAARLAAASEDVPTLEVDLARLGGAGVTPDPSAVDPAPGDTATIVYGPPDTGDPGGIELTHENLAHSASVAASGLLGLDPDDTVLSCFPVFHPLGQTCGLNATVIAGACLSIPQRFDPAELLRVLDEHRVTVLTTFPLLLAPLLRETHRGGRDFATLRTILASGGSPIGPRQRAQLESRFGCGVLESYGPTQSAALACATAAGAAPRPGSIGATVEGVEAVVVDRHGNEMAARQPGELLLRGPHVMAGYWERPDATSKAFRDGWLRTGESARRDEDGHLYLIETNGWAGVFSGGPGREPLLRRLRQRFQRRRQPTEGTDAG